MEYGFGEIRRRRYKIFSNSTISTKIILFRKAASFLLEWNFDKADHGNRYEEIESEINIPIYSK